MKRLGSKLLLIAVLGMLLGQVHAQNTNNLCINANPFCTDENPYGVSFPAGTDATATPDLPDAQRGCLYYTPAPAWYVMQIDNPGSLLIYLEHSGGRDIDFACWGPFEGYNTYGELLQAVCTSRLTGDGATHRPNNGYHDPNNPGTWGGYPSGNLIDCSYSAQSTEWCFIPNAQVGQWYIFLICNYSRAPGTISFSVQDGEATTNCNILASISNNGPLCEGEDLQLFCNATSTIGYSWTGPNGFTSNQQNPIIPNVTPAASGTYTVVYQPNNSNEPQTGSTLVEVYDRPSASITPSQTALCNGEAVLLEGSSDCNDCQFQWSNGSDQHSISVMPRVTTTYTLTVTNGNCSSVASQTITVGAVPTVAVAPAVITLCSAIGFVDLEAISTQCGTGCSYVWSNGTVGSVNHITMDDCTADVDNIFTVTCTNSYGCTAEAYSIVRMTENVDVAECNVFYADNHGDPASQGLTPSSPTTIEHAIEQASCTNAIIRLDTGRYVIDQPIRMASNLTLEGGFMDEYKIKTSEIGATTIYRSNQYVEGTSTAPRLVAIEANSLNDFRLQDLTIQTANAPELPAVNTATNAADDKDCYNMVDPGELIPTVTVNIGNTIIPSTTTQVLPGTRAYSRYVTLYKASEIGDPMTFTALGFDVASLTDVPADGSLRHLRITLVEVPFESFNQFLNGNQTTNGCGVQYFTDLYNMSGATTVYDGYFCVDGTGLVTFPINYDYQGGNLMVILDGVGCYTATSNGGCALNVRGGTTNAAEYMSGRNQSQTSTPQSANNQWNLIPRYYAERPNISFFTCTDRTVAGNVVATVSPGSTPRNFPLPGESGHHRTVALYTDDEIGTGPRMLSGIALDVASISANAGRTRTVRIYMKNTTDVTLNAGQVWNQYISNASLVYSGTFCEDATGWTTFPVDFAYEGNSLMVMIEGEGCGSTGGCPVMVNCSSVSDQCVYTTTNEGAYYSINTLAASAYRPNLQLYSTSSEDDIFYVNESNYGVSTYGIHLANCGRYDIVRCRIMAGNASRGKNGTVGKNGGDGGNGGNGNIGLTGVIEDGVTHGEMGTLYVSGGAGGLGGRAGTSAGTATPAGQGGNGGQGGQYKTQSPFETNAGGNGTDGGNNPGSRTMGHTAGSNASSQPGMVTAAAQWTDPTMIQTAANGAAGVNGTNGVTANPIYNNYFNPGVQVNGGDGTGGAGGGGGGGGGAAAAKNTYSSDMRLALASGSGGGAGGGGGGGGQGGGGGYGGGSSFGIYSYNDAGDRNIMDCYITAGAAGIGGNGAVGGTGGTGGAGGTCDDIASIRAKHNNDNTLTNYIAAAFAGYGDNGGSGGNGGNGGRGADGATGASHATVDVTNLGVPTAPAADFTNWPTLLSQNIIHAGSHEKPYTSCTDVEMDMCSVGDQLYYTTFGSEATPSSGNSCTTIQYTGITSDLPNQVTATGRKTPQATGASTSNRYSGFNLVLFSPVEPGHITGNPDVCPGEYSYCIAYETGYFYSWDIIQGREYAEFISDTTINCVAVSFTNSTNEVQQVALEVQISPPCCPSFVRDTFWVDVEPMVHIDNITSTRKLCEGANSTLWVMATPPDATYQWMLNGNPINGATSSTYTVTDASEVNTGEYVVVVTGACNVEMDTVQVQLIPMPEVTVMVDEPLCVPAYPLFIFTSNMDGVEVTFTFEGNTYTITVDEGENYVDDILAHGTGIVSVVSAESPDHCVNNDVYSDLFLALNSEDVTSAGADRTYCDTYVPIEAVEPDNEGEHVSYGHWELVSTNPSGNTVVFDDINNYSTHFTASGPGEYEIRWVLTVENPCPNEVADTVVITITEPLDLTFDPGLTSCFGEPVNIAVLGSGGTAPYTYYWIDNSDPDNPEVIGLGYRIEGLVPGVDYLMVMMDENECEFDSNFVITLLASQSINIHDIDTLCPNAENVPVAITIDDGTAPFHVAITYQGRVYEYDTEEHELNYDLPLSLSGCDIHDTVYLAITDRNGCTAYDTAAFVVADLRAPAISGTIPNDTLACPSDIPTTFADLSELVAHLSGGDNTITDNCTSFNRLRMNLSESTSTNGCRSTLVRTYTVSDECDNSTTITHTIIVEDTIAPVVDGTLSDMRVACLSEVADAITDLQTLVETFNLTVSDNCSRFSDLDLQVTTEPFTALCNASYVRTYTITDTCGNSTVLTQNIIFNDDAAPVVTGALRDTTIYAAADCSYSNVTAYTTVTQLVAAGLVVTDCNLVDEITYADDNTDLISECVKRIERTYTVSDSCGHSTTITQTIYVEDTISPAVDNILHDTTIYYTDAQCHYDEVTPLAITDFHVTDCNEVNLVVTHRDTVGAPGDCEWSYVRVYSFTDICNNTPTVLEQTITIKDTTRPQVVDNLEDTTLYYIGNECDLDAFPRLTLADFEVEDCRYEHLQFSVVERDTTDGGEGCSWTYTRVYTFADDCNNTSVSIDQLITVRDTTRPAIAGMLADTTIYRLADCTYELPTNLTIAGLEAAGLTITDCNLDNNVAVSDANLEGDDCSATVVRTYTISDLCGNTNTITQNIIIEDTTRPYLTAPIADSLLTATNCEFVVPDFVTIARTLAADNCTATADIDIQQSVAAGTPVTAAMDVTVTLEDACGNPNSYTIHITLPEELTLTLHQGDTAVCEGQSVTLPTTFTGGVAPYVYAWTPTSGLTPTDADTVVATPEDGTYNYEVTLTDGNGCTATTSVTVTVDTMPAEPILSSTADVACQGGSNGTITIESPVGTGYSYSLNNATLQDTANVYVGLSAGFYTVMVQSNTVNNTNCQATSTIEVESSPTNPRVAIDSLAVDLLLCPNQGTQEITARIISGTEPFVVTWTGATVDPTDSLTATVAVDATACDSVYTVNIVITDGNECEASSEYAFRIVDTLAPAIHGVLVNDTVACPNDVPAPYADLTALNDALVGADAGIEDSCTIFANLDMTVETANYTQSCEYQIVRTYTVTDECGNASTITHAIIVHDTIAPVITGTIDAETVVCVADFTDAVQTVDDLLALLQGGTITDNCCDAEHLTLTSTTQNFTSYCNGDYIRTYTVTDSCGNSTSIEQHLIVNDNVTPVIEGTLADITIFADSACTHTLPTAYTAVAELETAGLTITDCNLVAEIQSADADMVDYDNCNTLVVRTYTVSDSCNNTSTITQNIYIQDTIHPWLSEMIADSLLTGVNCEFEIPDFEAIAVTLAQDNCTAQADIDVEQSPAAGTSTNADGDVTITLTDGCGLQTTYTVHYTLPTVPVLTLHQGDTAVCEGQSVTLPTTLVDGTAPFTYSWTPTDGLNATNTDTVVATPDRGTYTYTVSVTDANGCTSQASVTVEVDTIPATPVMTQEPNVACQGDANGSITITYPVGSGYSYSLNNADPQDTTNVYHGLIQGQYTVVVITDAAAGCQSSGTIEVENSPAIPTIAIDTLLVDLCPNQGTQEVTAQIINGLAPFIVTWENATMNPADSLSATVSFDAAVCDSNYSVTVRIVDGNECETFSNYIFRVADSLAPMMTEFVDTLRVEGCDESYAPAVLTTEDDLAALGVSYTDECTAAGNFIVNCTADTAGTCPIVITRYYTVTDECGHVSEPAIHRILIDDETAPEVTVNEVVDTLNSCGAQNAPAAATTPAELQAIGFAFSDLCTATADLTLALVADTTSDGCTVEMTRAYTVTDACGNESAAMTHIIRIHDSIAPVINNEIPELTLYGCDTTTVLAAYPTATTVAELLALGGITITEACTAQDEMVVHHRADSTGLCEIMVARTYWVEDACGNLSNEVSHVIRILDTFAPTVNVTLSDTTIYYTTTHCDYDEVAILSQDYFNAQDCHQVNMEVVHHDTVGAPGDCEWSYIRDYRFTDECGNGPVIVSHQIMVKDTMRPQVVDDLRDTILYYVGNDCTLPTYPRLTLSDFNVEDCRYDNLQFSVIERDTTNNGEGCEWSYTRVYTFADDCNNTSVSIDQLITIQDTTRPAIAGTLLDLTVYRLEDCSYVLPDTLTVAGMSSSLTTTDCNLDYNNVGIAHSDMGGNNCEGTIIRTYTLSDLCGNSTTINQTIHILDTTSPYLTEIIPDTVLVSNDCHFVVPDFVTIAYGQSHDNCTTAADLTITQSVAAGTDVTADMDVTVTLADACGNDSSYTVHITLPSIPEITLHQGDTAICEGESVLLPTTYENGTAPYEFSWTPTDGLSSTTADTVTATPAHGVYAYVVTITDANGCTATATATVTVDTLPAVPELTSLPNVACHGDANGSITVLNPLGTGYTYSLNGTDFQDEPLFEGLTDSNYVVTVLTAEGCQSTGTIAVDRSPAIPAVAIDSLTADLLLCPNQGTQTITAQILNGLPPYTVTWNGATQSATDSLTATVDVDAANCNAIYSVTVTIVDANECEAHNTYNFSIVDTMAPVITGIVPNDTVACPNDVPAVFADLTALANALVGDETSIVDSCTTFANLEMSVEAAEYVQSCEYQIVRTYTVTDECGNSSSITHTIYIHDTIAPVISGTLADVTVVCVEEMPAAVQSVAELLALLQGDDAAITDNCSDFAGLTLTSSTPEFTALCHASYVRTYTVSDTCGNTTTITQNLIFEDNVDPVVEGALADITIYADSSCNHTLPAAWTTVADLTDAGLDISDCNLASDVTVSDADMTVVDACTNLVVRTYTVSDSCGNSTTTSQNIYIEDTIHPWMQPIADTLLVSTDCHFLVPDFEAAAALLAHDNCTADADIDIHQSIPAGTELTDAADVVLTLTDLCGLQSTYTIHVTIPEVLEIAITQNDTAFCDGGNATLATEVTGGTPNFTYSWTPTTGLDDPASSAPVAAPTEGTYNYEVEVTDANGCTAQAGVEVVVWESPDTAEVVITPNSMCEDGYNGIIEVTSPLGAYYLYSLNGGEYQSSPVFDELRAGTYVITVQTQDGCTSESVTVVVPNSDDMPNASIIITQSIICPTAGNQTVTATVEGGEGPYFYDWQGDAILSVDDDEAVISIDPDACDSVYSFFIEVVDINNCVSTAYATITARDVEAPTIDESLVPIVLDECSVDDAPAAASSVDELEEMGITVSDNCTDNEDLVVTYEDQVTGSCPILITRTYTLTDHCGLQTSTTQTITIQDLEIPVAEESDVEEEVQGCSLSDAPAVVTSVRELSQLGFNIFDNCTSLDDMTFTYEELSYDNCPIVLERHYVVYDACQNVSDTLWHTIFIMDEEAPVLSGNIAPRLIEGCDITALGDDTLIHTVAGLQELGLQVTEDCSFDSLVVYADEQVEGHCPIVVTRTYQVEDLCGNLSNTFTQVINIQDTTKPVFADMLTELTLTSENCRFLVPDFEEEAMAHVSDNCSDGLTFEQSIEDGSSLTTTTDIVLSMTDECGNTATHTIHLIVPEELQVSIAQNDTAFCEGGNVLLAATVTDGTTDYVYAWSPVTGLDVTDQSQVTATPAMGNYSYEVLVTDDNGCTATAAVNVTVNESPAAASMETSNNTICNGTPNGIITITSPLGDYYEYSLNGGDFQSDPVFNNLDAGTYTIVVRTTDGCLSAEATATIETVLNWPEVALSVESNLTVFCPSVGTREVTAATIGGQPEYTYTWSGVTNSNEGTATLDVNPDACDTTYQVMVVVEDEYHCTATASVTLTARDVTPPAILGRLDTSVYYGCDVSVLPAPATTGLQLNGLGLMLSENCTNPDICEVSSYDDVSGYCPITIVRHYTIIDHCGNVSNELQQVMLVLDNMAPTVTAANITTNVNGCTVADAPAVITDPTGLAAFGFTFSDNCSDITDLTVSCVADTSDTHCPITIVRNYSVTDPCGNSRGGMVNTIEIFDSVAPALSGTIATVAIDGCDLTALENYAAVTTADALAALGITINEECSDVEVFSEETSAGECPIVVTRTYWVVDECGNVSNTVSQTINIQDTTSPYFTNVIPEQYLVGQGGQFFIPDLSAIALALSGDDCTPQGQITMTQTPAVGVQVTHDQDVTVVIYDLCNNTDTMLVPVILPDVLQIHIVQDDARFCFGDSILLTPSVGGGSMPYAFEWTPNDGGLNAYDTLNVTARPSVGTHVYTVTVTDFNGSTASDDITIIVDSIPAVPTLVATGNTVCDGTPNGTITITNPLGSDYTYSLNGGTYQSEPSFGELTPGTYTVTVQTPAGCTSDPATVEVPDETASPVITIIQTLDTLCPNVGTYTLTAEIVGGEAPFTYTWSGDGVADANDLTTTLTVDANACNTFYVSNINVVDANNCTATDADTVYVRDTDLPTITGDLAVVTYNGCTIDVLPAVATTATELEALGVTLADNCTAADALVVNMREVVDGSCPIVVSRYYTVTDACGNVSEEFLHTLQVFDSVAPQVTVNEVTTHLNGCDETAADAVATTPAQLLTLGFVFEDGCTGVNELVVNSEETIDGTCPTTITRTYTVTDECGNVSATMTHTITVFDSIAPVINGAIAEVTVDGCSVNDIADRPMATTVAELLALGGITIDEACSSDDLTLNSSEAITYGCPIVVMRTYSVTDLCGNTSNEVTETITIQDVTAPVFAEQVAEHLLASSDCQFVVPDLVEEVRAVSSDNCVTDPAELIITQEPAAGTAVTADMTVAVTVTDTCGNASVMNIQLRLPTVVTLSIEPSTTQYCEWDTVALTAMPEGGNGNYTYEWTPATGLLSTTDSIVMVNTEEQNFTYHLVVTDGNGCTAQADFTLPEPSHLTVSVAQQHIISCFEGRDGAVVATAENGAEDYTYAWNNGTMGALCENLPEGTYTVTATDAYGCTATASIDITHPTELTATISDETAVLCFGDANGSGTVTPTGGTAPYMVSINNNATTYPVGEGDSYTFTGLVADTYTVLVTDANGCTFTTTLTVGTPEVLAVTETANTMPLCFNGDDGTATGNLTGGTLPYTVSVNGTETLTADAEGEQLIQNLSAGSYTVSVVDDHNCSAQITITINQPDALQLAEVGTVNVSCFGLSDATATVSMNGGTTPYTLWINNNEQQQTVNTIQNVTFTNLPAGTHTVTVQDANGCLTTMPVTITEPNELALTATDAVAVLCFGDANGTILVTPTEGTAPYTVTVDNFVTTQVVQAGGNYTFTGLTAGDFTASVRDANGCEATADFTITTPDALTLAEVSTTDPLCYQGSDGQVEVTMAGGVEPYSMTVDGTAYANNLTAGSSTITDLNAGDHVIVITDANGCTATVTSMLGEPDLLTLTQDAITPITCHDGDDGTVTISVAGGTASYSIWIDASLQQQTLASAAETALFTDMNGGAHSVTVVDDHQCTTTLQVSFVNPDPFSTVVDATTDVLCFNESNGTVTFTVSGGTVPYVVTLDPTIPDITLNSEDPYTYSQLWAADYQANIVDAHGCAATMQFTINEPDTLNVEARVVNNVSCFSYTDGNVTADVTGGVQPYSYNWDNDQHEQDMNNVGSGFYVVTVSDYNGCIATDTTFVSEPELLHVELVTVTESCAGEETAVIDVDAMGGTPEYTFLWSNGATTDSIFNLAVGFYTVTVTDANGCPDTMTVEVPYHALPDFTVSVTPAYCDRPDGTATVVGSNTELYTYDWHADNNPNAPFNDALPGGSYVLTVDDGVCTLDLPFTINNIPGPTAIFDADPTTFIQGAVVRYHDHSIGSVVSWNYDFGDGYSQNVPSASHEFNEPGEFITVLTVTDEHNCFDTAQITITVIPDVIYYAPNAFTPNGDGMNDVWLPIMSNYGDDFYELYIYNRWGQLLFKSNDPNVGWDGTFNGNKLEGGVYVYAVGYHNLMGKLIKREGTITLIR